MALLVDLAVPHEIKVLVRLPGGQELRLGLAGARLLVGLGDLGILLGLLLHGTPEGLLLVFIRA
eukprot:5920993-Alexandrium_andersonii.AAC.1